MDEKTKKLVELAASLFSEHEDTSTMDAAEFKDNCSEIWDIVDLSREIVLLEQK